jgi:tryptophanyl-tRNA synthetase
MVYYYHKLINSSDLEKIEHECRHGERGCVGCKKELVNNMMAFLKPIQEKRKYYEDHPEEVEEILKDGTKKAQAQAAQVIKRVKANMHIDYFKDEENH